MRWFDVVIDVIGRASRRPRRVTAGDGRFHIELRDLGEDELTAFGDAIELAVLAIDGVSWAAVHRPTHRLVVAHDGSVTRERLVALVEQVEADLGFERRSFLEAPDHPADPEPIVRDLLGLGADLVGITLGVAVQAMGVRPPPFEVDLAAALSVADQVLPVRRLVERRIGPPLADLALGFGNAIAQGITQGPLGPMVDLGNRVLLFGELTDRRRAWLRREPGLFAEPPADHTPGHRPARPTPMPDSPIERYADLSWLAAILGGGLTLVSTRRPERAATFVQATMPKAARLGREGYASQLGRILASRDVLALDPQPLRVLDRVDVLIADAAALGHGRLPVDLLAAAADRAGIRLIVANSGEQPGPFTDLETVDADLVAELVPALQREGHVVAVTATTPCAGLLAADVALGLHLPAAPVPWGAHLLAGDDPTHVLLLVEAIVEAKRVTRESVRLATLGGVAGVLLAVGTLLPGRSLGPGTAVNAAAALALTNGVRHAVDLSRRPFAVPRDPTPWHALDVETVLDRLGSGPDGLSPDAAVARIRPEPSPPPLPVAFARAVAGELINPLTPVLEVGAAMSAAVGSLVDAGLVTGVVALNGLIGGVQQLRADQAVAALRRTRPAQVTVIRQGTTESVHPRDLVQGDLIRLQAGSAVPADCRIVTADALEVDESALTGESLPIAKGAAPTDAEAVADRTSMLYQGTWVAAGETTAVVVATGPDTEASRAVLLAGDPPPSGVEARLRSWTGRMMPLAVGGGAFVVVNGLLRGRPLRDTVGAGVSLAVAAVPEGLPLIATVAQLAAARRLSRRNVLVRNSRAIEALGRVDVVCADKTGTLTEGRISLQLVSDGLTSATPADLSPDLRRVFAASLRATPLTDDPTSLPHPTDRALVEAGLANGVEGERAGWRPSEVLPFEPGRAYHATLGVTDTGRVITVKGAPEVVLPRCVRWRRGGSEVTLGEAERAALDAAVTGMARTGLRVLAVAETETVDPTVTTLDDSLIEGLTLLGFVGLADQARATAADAVGALHRAGVDVLMITGDHPSTAEGVGAELGLLNGGRVVTGAEIDACDDDELAGLLREHRVFARVTPAHKVRIVQVLQRDGHVVAMTGDGANDAPAIRLADVGIALGRRSTPAAQSAADLVVLDERIERILDTVLEGRALWASVRDAVAVLVGGNLGEISFIVIGSALSGTSPLNARQLLLVNLLTDVAPALAIATRPPRARSADQLLHEGPDVSLGSALDRAIAWRAGATAASAAVAWTTARVTGRRARADTVALIALVGAQLGQTVLAGGRDPIVLLSGFGSAAVLGAIVQTPGLSQLFGCTPVGPVGWTIGLASAATGSVAASMLPRLLDRPPLRESP